MAQWSTTAMTCCELCSEITECTQHEVGGDLVTICQDCLIAEHLENRNRERQADGQSAQDDEYEETLI
jgi:hypothetical protein